MSENRIKPGTIRADICNHMLDQCLFYQLKTILTSQTFNVKNGTYINERNNYIKVYASKIFFRKYSTF